MSIAVPSDSDLLAQMSALGELARGRILVALEGHELSVRELQEVLQMPQSTVSRHLRTLADTGWIGARQEGPSHWYRLRTDLGEASRRLWTVVQEELTGLPIVAEDRQRVRAALARRHTRSRAFFATEAGRWDRLREELFGARYDLQVLLGLLRPEWTVGDLGCGTGSLSAQLAPAVRKVIAVDESPAMLEAARGRLRLHENVSVREGELELLPIGESELDLAVLSLVLPFVPSPERVLAEAARALQPGGRLLIIDLQPHDRVEYTRTMGHLWQGFSGATLRGWCAAAGLLRARTIPLLPEPAARGPALLVASAEKPV